MPPRTWPPLSTVSLSRLARGGVHERVVGLAQPLAHRGPRRLPRCLRGGPELSDTVSSGMCDVLETLAEGERHGLGRAEPAATRPFARVHPRARG
jgi:hypothetical protein